MSQKIITNDDINDIYPDIQSYTLHNEDKV